MKIHLLASALTASTLTIATTFLGSSPASAEKTTFVCSVSNGLPATVAQTSRGNVAVIRWNSDYFSGSGWTAQRRCQEVSKKFHNYYQSGALNYLTTGIMNGQPVVCVAGFEGGGCSKLLFTLKPESNVTPAQKLQQLLAVRVRASGPLNESSARVYIDMKEFLKMAPVESVTSGSSSNDQPHLTSPSRSQPASHSGNGVW